MDILAAGRELVVSAPTLAQSRITVILDKMQNGVKFRVITRSAESYTVEQQTRVLTSLQLLENAGAEVTTLPKLTQRYAVIDNSIVWYGDINYLSSSKQDDTAVRLESPELAGELLDLEPEQ